MHLSEDRQYFGIAREGLKSVMPDGWKPCKAGDGTISYCNLETSELRKEHPCDDFYRKQFMREKENDR